MYVVNVYTVRGFILNYIWPIFTATNGIVLNFYENESQSETSEKMCPCEK